MRVFDFYEFVGILLPGSMVLLAVGWVYDMDPLSFALLPNSFGGLGAHLLLAYVVGHLLHSIGNIVEFIYWRLWGGMPTDWPLSRPARNKFPDAKEALARLCQDSNESLSQTEWRSLVAQARSTLYVRGHAKRLQFFNGNYSLFRGLIAAVLVVFCFAWNASTTPAIVYPVLSLVLIISLYRMHRFAIHYAREFFAGAMNLVYEEQREST